jgi:hypothetical protein
MAKATEKSDEVTSEARKTCFVMMPISDADGYPEGHFKEVYDELIFPAVDEAGYDCVLATSTGSAHMIQLEVVTKIATAPLCICDLSTNNPNVLFEYGLRQAFDLPTVLIKDNRTRRIFDLSGFRDIEYDHTLRIANILKSRRSIVTAINDTVAGSTDGQQVFSLVKLMNLTKAALPQGDIDPKDARFALLERKLDGIASAVLNRSGSLQDSNWSAGPFASHNIQSTATSDGPKFYAADGKLYLVEDGVPKRITDMRRLEATSVFKRMSEEHRAELIAFINREAAEFH